MFHASLPTRLLPFLRFILPAEPRRPRYPARTTLVFVANAMITRPAALIIFQSHGVQTIRGSCRFPRCLECLWGRRIGQGARPERRLSTYPTNIKVLRAIRAWIFGRVLNSVEFISISKNGGCAMLFIVFSYPFS